MSILIFLPNYIGDILMTTPAIRFLKSTLPEQKIFVVIKKVYSVLVEDNPDISGMFFKDEKKFLQKNIKLLKPDVCLLFRTTFYNSYLSFIIRPKYSIGMDQELSKMFLTKVLSRDVDGSYRYKCYLLSKILLKDFFKIENQYNPDLSKIYLYGFDEEEVKRSLNKKLLSNNISFNKNIILINPSSSRKTKVLTLEQQKNLIQKVRQTFLNYEIVIVGNKESKGLYENILQQLGVKSFFGELNLKELSCLIKASKLLITPDSGPAYIAQAVGTKVIIYFTSTDPKNYGPYNENVKIIYSSNICNPCHKNVCNRKYICIKKFDIKNIIDTVKIWLKDEI